MTILLALDKYLCLVSDPEILIVVKLAGRNDTCILVADADQYLALADKHNFTHNDLILLDDRKGLIINRFTSFAYPRRDGCVLYVARPVEICEWLDMIRWVVTRLINYGDLIGKTVCTDTPYSGAKVRKIIQPPVQFSIFRILSPP